MTLFISSSIHRSTTLLIAYKKISDFFIKGELEKE